jgi:hypothetical protein
LFFFSYRYPPPPPYEEEKKKKERRVKPNGLTGLHPSGTTYTHTPASSIMLTDTDLMFRQVWCGQVWRTYTFPRLTPVKFIANELLTSEAPLRKALVKRKTNFKQWDIVRR